MSRTHVAADDDGKGRTEATDTITRAQQRPLQREQRRAEVITASKWCNIVLVVKPNPPLGSVLPATSAMQRSANDWSVL